MKFIVHDSEAYYPDVSEFDDFPSAERHFAKLRNSRMSRIDGGSGANSERDYLAIVIDSFDAEEYFKVVQSGE